jgi:formate-dependent nitrite reductase membrane component NrfD
MLAAEIWHWWIGVALTLLGIGILVAGLVGYMKTVSSQKYPGGKARRHSDL